MLEVAVVVAVENSWEEKQHWTVAAVEHGLRKPFEREPSVSVVGELVLEMKWFSVEGYDEGIPV